MIIPYIFGKSRTTQVLRITFPVYTQSLQSCEPSNFMLPKLEISEMRNHYIETVGSNRLQVRLISFVKHLQNLKI